MKRVRASRLPLPSRTLMCCDDNILRVKPFKLSAPTPVFYEAMILPFAISLIDVFSRKLILTLVRASCMVIDQM